jgi:hypothetical protein
MKSAILWFITCRRNYGSSLRYEYFKSNRTSNQLRDIGYSWGSYNNGDGKYISDSVGKELMLRCSQVSVPYSGLSRISVLTNYFS